MYFRGLLLQINEARMYVAELAIDLAAAADNSAGGRPRLSARPVQGPFPASTRPPSAFQIPSEATHSRNGAIAAAQNCKMLFPLTKECLFRQIWLTSGTKGSLRSNGYDRAWRGGCLVHSIFHEGL